MARDADDAARKEQEKADQEEASKVEAALVAETVKQDAEAAAEAAQIV